MWRCVGEVCGGRCVGEGEWCGGEWCGGVWCGGVWVRCVVWRCVGEVCGVEMSHVEVCG